MTDLFTYRYPEDPGFKARTTSIDAAVAARPTAATLRAQCRALLEQHSIRGLTADEAAKLLGLSVLSIRPRFSELAAKGTIVDSGNRRQNESGKRAIVWVSPIQKKGQSEQ